MTASALVGKRIVITRPPHKTEEFAAKLRALGAIPVLAPMIAIRAPEDTASLDETLHRLDSFDWLIVTSANGVTYLWERIEALGVTVPPTLRWAVIGPATAKALRQRGIEPDLMPAEHVAEALFAALADQVDLSTQHILLPQGNLARDVLSESLTVAGAQVTSVIVYETYQPDLDPALLAEPFDAITFTSSSTVTHFAARFRGPSAVLRSALIACLGPVTANTVRAMGWPVHVMAEPYTVDGLIAALERAFEVRG